MNITAQRVGTFARITSVALCATIFTNCRNNMKINPAEYPSTFADSTVVDNYHGTQVADPYRWLEDDNSAQTAEWVKTQNAFTQSYFECIPYRNAIKERLTELWNYPSESAPTRHGDWFYFSRNDGLQNQSVLYRRKDEKLGSPSELFFDPNTLSEDGTVAVQSASFTKDGRYYAYSLATAGSDWVEIRVMDTATKQNTDDHIRWVKFSGAAWAADFKGFYYSAYDEPKEGVYSAQNSNQKVFYHRLGTQQSDDKLIYADPAHPMRYFGGFDSEDGRWEFIASSEGTSGSEILFRHKGEKAFRTLLAGFDYEYDIIDCVDDKAYVVTNQDAPNNRLIRIDLTRPTAAAEVIIPESKNLLDGVGSVGGALFASYLRDAQTEIVQFDMNGRKIRDVELPAIGTAGGFYGEREDTALYYGVTGYTTPGTLYHYDIASGKSTLYKSPEVQFDPSQFETKQVFYPSTDGTMIPMFITYKKGLKLNGKNPCYLYAYGGFQINLTPSFSISSVMFMEQGGVYCVANLRGGSEYGEKWHKAGMLASKQNVFDDFISAAEYLISEGYTSSEKLAIAGGSNGGLLVGACEVQRPDLFAVCLPAVGVMDMLRYHRFTIGWGWAVEYGTSDNAEQFPYLYAYSPLHNIRQGVKYPATLIKTADHDDRVVPAHSFKFAATLQRAQSGDNPILIRIEHNAGHGAGKPTSKIIDELADTYAFLFFNTNTDYKTVKK